MMQCTVIRGSLFAKREGVSVRMKVKMNSDGGIFICLHVLTNDI